jgi:Ca-activated chloride channel family protein
VRGLARVGRGAAEFVYPGERIEPKVLRQFGRLLTAALTDIAVEWGGLKSTTAPDAMPPIFDGERIVTYAFLDELRSTTVTVSARQGERVVSFGATLDPSGVTTGRTIGTLAARRRIRELEEQPEALARRGSRQRDRVADRNNDEIIRLATAYQLMSRETSFVAIERRAGAAPGELALRRLPVALRSGYGGADMLSDAGALRASRPDRNAMSALASLSMRMASRAPAAKPLRDRPLFSRRRVLPDASGHASDRPLDHLVAVQSADGSWDLTRVFAGVMHIALDVLEQRMPPMQGVQQQKRVWATTLALAWLELRAAANRDEWTLLARKAGVWLQSAASADVIAATRRVAEAMIAGS